MNFSTLPNHHHSSLETAIEAINQQIISFKLLHINSLIHKLNAEKSEEEKRINLISYFQKKGILSSLPKPSHHKSNIRKSKSQLCKNISKNTY